MRPPRMLVGRQLAWPKERYRCLTNPVARQMMNSVLQLTHVEDRWGHTACSGKAPAYVERFRENCIRVLLGANRVYQK
jgi:hypothetical protein